MSTIRLTKPFWDNGVVCWVERQQANGEWRRCEKAIGHSAKCSRDEDGIRHYQGRRTCWWHRQHEKAAQAVQKQED